MSHLYNFTDRDAFSRHYLKPLLVDALEVRLAARPAPLPLPAAAIVEASDSETGHVGEPRFVRTSQGWTWREHALLAWRTAGPMAHRRISEQEHRYDVIVSQQPDMAGRLRLTVDLHALRNRYERDTVSHALASGATHDLGTGWARLTLRWSLRLQLVLTAAGRANVVTHARRVAPRADAGRTGPYVSGDPFSRLLDARRIERDWEQGSTSLGVVKDQLVSRLAAAIEPPLWHRAPCHVHG
ncbi:hypothetical protein [Pseudoduganella lutea]|uniref:Uncharacterized protein n=1 Tax=Pseudoduganella lutea TaxID=321985 RepID=A0A4V0Z449_9BURK|nr:hypothetical protein [Pseudoduganella lutea]QBE65703.1 hypothetical protein EWM63_24215 [Pseudoduganella lutea]